MTDNPRSKKTSHMADVVAEAVQARKVREKGYRDRALKLFEHVCGRCGRAFEGKRLRELTVHHRDHDHDNNPPDGSNWELLCIYCHDNEHARDQVQAAYASGADEDEPDQSLSHQPFAGLEALLKKKQDQNKE